MHAPWLTENTWKELWGKLQSRELHQQTFFVLKGKAFPGRKLSVFDQSCKRIQVLPPEPISKLSHQKVFKYYWMNMFSLFNWSAEKCLKLPNNTDSSCFHVNNLLPKASLLHFILQNKMAGERQTPLAAFWRIWAKTYFCIKKDLLDTSKRRKSSIIYWFM